MQNIRNVAIIAHVDHGKTTLVDQIIKQAKIFRDNQEMHECFLDNNDIERERGITILSKNISVNYRDTKINIIDTPGHSDFGGQVERVLNLADGVLLLVDAAEGPLPQTRFVLDKALKLNLKPVVIINKVDRPDARASEVLNEVFDLFIDLDATEEQLDFPVLYGSGRDGWATDDLVNGKRDSILPLMDAMVDKIPPPEFDENGTLRSQISTLDYSDYVGRIGIGRVRRGVLEVGKPILHIGRSGKPVTTTLKQLFTFEGISRKEVQRVECGDICAVVGIDDMDIGDTLSDISDPTPMPPIAIDEPTLSMMFRVNDSPLFGQEGKFISSRHIRERLFKEAERDVALRVEELNDCFKVSGRGVLHISILIENMRREGYELTITQPHVIFKTIDGVLNEPVEVLTVDAPDTTAGKVIELVGQKRGEMRKMENHGSRQVLEFLIPTRGIIGIRTKIMNVTTGQAIMSHAFDHYEPFKGDIPQRLNGVMISMGRGRAEAYAIDALQLRGTFFIDPVIETYEGMIVGQHCTTDDLEVNLQRAKKLTNMRASGSDKNLKIAPAQKMSLEEALEYIQDDEYVEVTPKNIRMRKKFLTELERRRNRSAKLKSESPE